MPLRILIRYRPPDSGVLNYLQPQRKSMDLLKEVSCPGYGQFDRIRAHIL